MRRLRATKRATSSEDHSAMEAKPFSNRCWLLLLRLRCSDGSLYTGITNDLPKRLKAHAASRASKYEQR